jgi:hypothetical protein
VFALGAFRRPDFRHIIFLLRKVVMQSLVENLDEELFYSNPGSKFKIIAYGGYVIQSLYGGGNTRDVDSMSDLSDLNHAIKKINQSKLGGNEDHQWMNDDGMKFFFFHETLPEGWEERSFEQNPIFIGKSLTIYPLSRRDMGLTKLFGMMSRGGWDYMKDLESLRDHLKFDKDEIIALVEDLLVMLKGTRWDRPKESVYSFVKNAFEKGW